MNTMTTYAVRMALAVLTSCTFLGCGASFQVTTPPGYVELEDQEPDFDYRATTADGVILAIREIENKPKGDLGFWVQAIQNRMRDRAGYALLKQAEAIAGDGKKGLSLYFGHDEDSTSMLYTLTVFVTEDNIFLVEFGGLKDEVVKQESQHRAALASLKLK